jgi:hypothetical protein
MKIKELLPSKDYVNAKNISLFVNAELSREESILKVEKADNVFDFSVKFEQERNASYKFCLYGMVESKWGDCDNLKLDFRIGDSSTNATSGLTNYPFWIYDKSSNTSALTWSVLSKPLDSRNGDLSKNLYGKKKAHYFFPFELDIKSLTNTNKSIFVSTYNFISNLSAEQEFPFFYYNEDGLPLEYGSETAEILDNGNIIEINNNYPFFYDRHWIRREVEPTGPPFIYFEQEQITVTEGGSNDRLLENKFFDVEISISKPPRGYEKAKLNVVYGVDENMNEYTTVTLPQDVILNFNDIEWNKNDNLTKNIRIRITDDFYVEPVKRLTLQVTPILGLLPDPEKAQMISLYVNDNDVPSQVSFSSQSFEFTEPRQDNNPLIIPIDINLDRKLLVPNQSLEIYIDENETDCLSTFGFQNTQGTGFSNSIVVNLNQIDLLYSVNFYFISARQDDIQRKIVLKFRNLTSNLIAGSFNQGQSINYTLYVNKDIDKRYVELIIPYDAPNGIAVLRSLYNKPVAKNTYVSQGLNDNLTRLQTYYQSNQGYIEKNTLVTGNTDSKLLRSLVLEPYFKINFTNLGSNVVFDNKLYKFSETISVVVTSGFTTGVSTDQFVYDGKQFKLKLPANDEFFGGTIPAFLGLNQNSIWGFFKCKYSITFENNSYNYLPNIDPNSDNFKTSNLLSKTVLLGEEFNNALKINTDTNITLNSGNDNSKETYYFFTRIKNCFSQIQYDAQGFIESYTGTSLDKTTNVLYYPSAVIIPNGYLFSSLSNVDTTYNQIFITKGINILQNNFIPVAPLNSTQNNFPISDILLFEPFSDYQINLKLYFGQLLIQAGYGTLTTFPNGFTSPSVQDDSFVLATTQYGGSFTQKNLFLYDWSQANVNTKNQAVIEIINNGIVSSNILGFNVKPNEKIWISERPLSIRVNGVYNVVRSLKNLSFDVPTNDKFVYQINTNSGIRTVNKLTQGNYIISFLNFVLYNYNGTPSNKVINKSITFKKSPSILISSALGSSSQLTYQETDFFLRTRFSANAWQGSDPVWGWAWCNSFLGNLKKVSTSLIYRSIKINGFLATASNNCPIEDVYFSNDISINGDYCNKNGFTWIKSTNQTSD